jgi:hypothetical protein
MNTVMQHPFAIVGAYFVFSAIVGGMPVPTSTSSSGYVWMYNSLHILSGNLTTAVQKDFPGLQANVAATQHVETDTVIAKQ